MDAGFSCLGFGCAVHAQCQRYALVETAPELPRRGTCVTSEGRPSFVAITKVELSQVALSHGELAPTDKSAPRPTEVAE